MQRSCILEGKFPTRLHSASNRLVLATRTYALDCYYSILHTFCIFIAFLWGRNFYVFSIHTASHTVYQFSYCAQLLVTVSFSSIGSLHVFSLADGVRCQRIL